jgi:hypothetical protein
MIAIEPIAQALPWLLGIGLLLASLRLVLGLRRLAAQARPRAWRSATLLLSQCASAVLLFLLLRAPQSGDSTHTLHLLTAHAPTAPAITSAPRAGELWLRLPEAGPRRGIDPTPDLATALRQHPQVRTLHVIGDGLEARDRDAASGLEIRFERAPLADGIRDWWAPASAQPGDAISVRGSVIGGGRIELLDPAGQGIDQQALQSDGAFSLRSTTRSPGMAVYRLQLRDAGGTTIATTQVPVQVLPARPTHLLLRSGGPDPELKFLRRWAADNGATLQATIDLGSGMQAGDPPFALDARTLAGNDVLILDDRSWNGLGRASRDRVLAAVRDGMGLLLRASAPLTDRDALGLQVRSANLPSSYKLPAIDGEDPTLPVLTRPQLRIDNPSGKSVLHDGRGNALVAWRAHGRGRVGVWLPIDSYRLALAGHADLHARLWADAVNAVMRPRAAPTRGMPRQAYAGERVLLCDLGNPAHVLQPGDTTPVRLAIDPRSGQGHCAAFWPRRAGWHRLVDGDSDIAFLVRARDADPVLRSARTRRATAALAAMSPAAVEPAPARATLPRAVLFLLWLAATGGLWWFERSRLGRATGATPG